LFAFFFNPQNSKEINPRNEVQNCCLARTKLISKANSSLHYENNSSILWFSDEAVLHLSGRVNRHNIQIWGTENPKVIEKERDSLKLVVWCAISPKGIISPYFFRDDARRTTTVTEENNMEMLQKFFMLAFLFIFCVSSKITEHHLKIFRYFLTCNQQLEH